GQQIRVALEEAQEALVRNAVEVVDLRHEVVPVGPEQPHRVHRQSAGSQPRHEVAVHDLALEDAVRPGVQLVQQLVGLGSRQLFAGLELVLDVLHVPGSSPSPGVISNMKARTHYGGIAEITLRYWQTPAHSVQS